MTVDVRKGQGDVKLTREEFARRLRERFYDPEFEQCRATDRGDHRRRVDGLRRISQEPAQAQSRPGFADPEFELPVEWLETRERNQRPSSVSR